MSSFIHYFIFVFTPCTVIDRVGCCRTESESRAAHKSKAGERQKRSRPRVDDTTEGRDSDHCYATQEENVKEIRVRGAFDRHKFNDRGDQLSALAAKKDPFIFSFSRREPIVRFRHSRQSVIRRQQGNRFVFRLIL